VCHNVALPFYIKKGIFLRQKKNYEKKLKYLFHPAKIYNLQKILLKFFFKKKTKILQDIITNIKFQHEPKIIIFQKSSYFYFYFFKKTYYYYL